MLINATSRSSGPQTAGPTPHERGRRAFSYGAGPVGWGPELREVALIKISLSLAYRTIDYRFVVIVICFKILIILLHIIFTNVILYRVFINTYRVLITFTYYFHRATSRVLINTYMLFLVFIKLYTYKVNVECL